MNPGTPKSRIVAGPNLHIAEPQTYTPESPHITLVRCTNPMAPDASCGICACGTATKEGAHLYDVWAAVLGGLLGSIPGSHSQASNPTHCVDFDKTTTTGYWRFVGNNLVTNTPCSVNPPTDNNATFVVWFTFDDATTTEFPMGRNIAAQCSTQSNCDGSGSSPCAERLQIAPTEARATVAVETAPRQYQVTGGKARGPLASLVHTNWLLTLRAESGPCIWDNGGDGAATPRVELCPNGLLATEWRLTVTRNGQRICYTCPARDWDALAANRLRIAESAGGDGLPKSLTVSPV